MNWTMIAPIALLFVSNVFMTFAFYGQLKYPAASLSLMLRITFGTRLVVGWRSSMQKSGDAIFASDLPE